VTGLIVAGALAIGRHDELVTALTRLDDVMTPSSWPLPHGPFLGKHGHGIGRRTPRFS
jgi:hypothetical protein